MNTMMLCPHCNSENETDSRFCTNCGRSLSGSTPQSGANVFIGGDVPGQVAVGSNITQEMTPGTVVPQITQADLDNLRWMLADLKAQIDDEAPLDKKAAALERVQELEEAVTAKKPDLTTMEYVKNWFAKNLPNLAGAVTGVIVNPIIGALVKAAGELAAEEFKRRFGVEPPGTGP